MATKKRLIDANPFMKAGWHLVKTGKSNEYLASMSLADVPTVDAVEVVHGRWVLGKVEPGYFTPGGNRPWVCSECGQVVSWRLDKPRENYCSNCGADMRGNDDGE